MARDYKRAAQKKKKKKPVPAWLYFFTGLSIGLFATMLVYLQLKGDVSEKARPPVADSKAKAPPEKQPDKNTQTQDKEKEKTVEPETAQADAKAEQKGPRFDFYTILPELEVIIPDDEIRQSKAKIIDKSFKSSKKGEYVLQAGSFKTREQADRRKAKLALLGVDASVQRVTINDHEIWYRVRIGPSNDLKQLDKIRSRLYKENITAIPLRVKPE